MKWITRERVKVDRVACPWLIKKFVDPDAEFLFVPTEQVMEVAEREGATPYDVKQVELGHHGKECSFEAILKKYHLTGDLALVEPAERTAAASVTSLARSLGSSLSPVFAGLLLETPLLLLGLHSSLQGCSKPAMI
jgi:hypothetical protein